MKRVAIIGVGLLGSAVADRLLAAGLEVHGYDTRPRQLEALRFRGLRPAHSVAEAAAGAEAVFTILPSLEAVEAVFTGPGGLVERAPRDAVLLQMSTISPPLARRLGETCAAQGVAFLDTPISGTSGMVARGDCTIYVGGEVAVAERCRPVFDAVAKKTAHIGPIGAATLAKLVTNLLVGLNTAALAEALVLAAKGGLAPSALVPILRESAAGSRMLDVRGPLMAERTFTEPQMKLDLFLKDFHLMLDEGGRLGVPLPLTGLARELCTAAAARGHGGQDIAAVITALEHLAGIDED